ncbi:hypothetical protein B0H12DRAFT_1242990 [Mycena haematopus]|nr:hypothetical protein B0H12DRAFT_1242990 [Mycena haematopus]
MSTLPSQHFRDFRQRSTDAFGTDLFFDNPEGFDFDSAPPYRLDAADVQWPPSRPFFTVIQEERATGDYQMSEEERKSIYFLRHPSIIRILPFLRRPRRFQRLSREYVVDLLDRAVPVFRTFVRAYPLLPHTPLQEGFIRALVLFVERVINRFPEHISEHWRVIFMNQSHDFWTERPRMPPFFRFPWTVEFSAAHPLVPFQLHEPDHNTLVRIRSPALVRLLEVLASAPRSLAPADVDSAAQALNHGVPALLQLARELRSGTLSPDFAHGIFNSTRSLIQLVPEGRRNRAWVLSLPPYNEVFGRSIFPRDFVFPDGAHENRNRTPFPLWSSAAPLGLTDPLLEFWSQRQTEFPSPESPPVLSPVPRITPPSRSEGVSPVYVPTSPISSPPFGFSPVSPNTMETSALFRDDTLTDDQRLDVLRSRVASRTPGPSADAGGESTLPSQTLEDSREDMPMPPVESTPPATQAFPSPPRSSAAFQRIASFRDANNPWPTLRLTGQESAAAVVQGRNPLAIFSLALPCRRTATPKRASLRPSTPFPRKSRAPSNGESEADNDVYVDVPTNDEPQPKRQKLGKKLAAPSPRARLMPTSPQSRSNLSTPRASRGNLALMRETEPTLFDVGCANCMLRNRECSHVSLGTLCPECHKGKLAACSHQFTVSEHLRTVNFLEQYTRLSDAQGNRLITAAMNARESYNLARAQVLLASTQVVAAQNALARWITARLRNLGPSGIPGADEVPEALRDDWDDMVDVGRKGFAKDDVDFRGNRDARLNSAISSSRDLLEDVRAKRAAARETTPSGPPDEEFLRAHSSAAGPSHLDFVGTASSSANATAGPSRLDYVPPTSPRSQHAIELLQEQDREQAEREQKEKGNAMDLDAPY